MSARMTSSSGWEAVAKVVARRLRHCGKASNQRSAERSQKSVRFWMSRTTRQAVIRIMLLLSSIKSFSARRLDEVHRWLVPKPLTEAEDAMKGPYQRLKHDL